MIQFSKKKVRGSALSACCIEGAVLHWGCKSGSGTHIINLDRIQCIQKSMIIR